MAPASAFALTALTPATPPLSLASSLAQVSQPCACSSHTPPELCTPLTAAYGDMCAPAGVLATQHSGLGFTRSDTGTCAPWPMRPFYTEEPITRGLLATLASSMQESLTARRMAFLKSGTIDVRATTAIANVLLEKSGDWIMHNPVDLGGGPLTAYFTNTNLYCCASVCPTW